MEKKIIGGEAIAPTGEVIPLSKAVHAGDFLFLSGQVALDQNLNVVGNDVGTQTRQVLKRIRTTLGLAECSMSEVVKVTVWLARSEDFAAFNKVYAEFFPVDPPARSTVRADLMAHGLLVEIEAVAYCPDIPDEEE